MAKSQAAPPPEDPPVETDSATGINNRLKRALCPVHPDHPGARVYKTSGRTRYCICDTCGRTWKQTGKAYNQASEWCEELADKLEKEARNPSSIGTRSVVVLDVSSVRKIADQLRALAGEAEKGDLNAEEMPTA